MSKNVLVAGVAVFALAMSGAQAAEKAPGPANGETSVALGLTASDGNTEQTIGNATILHARGDDLNKLLLSAQANYSETDSDTTAENWKFDANYKRILDDRLYGVGNFTYFHDEIADVEYRFTLSPGIGYFLLKETDATLGVEAGPAYVWEKVAGVDDEYWAARLAERYDRKLSDTSKCWQSLEYIPQIDDTDNYKINFEIGGEAVLSGPLSVRLVLQDEYNSTPAPGKEENDVRVIGALAFTI